MASCPFPFPTSINHHHRNRVPPPICCCSTGITNPMTFGFSSSKIALHSSFSFKRNSWRGRCHATGPQSERPSKKHPPPSSECNETEDMDILVLVYGVTATFTRFQDTLQIFFAVLFWMSLFFWSSAWGGRDGGRQNKGSRFRK